MTVGVIGMLGCKNTSAVLSSNPQDTSGGDDGQGVDGGESVASPAASADAGSAAPPHNDETLLEAESMDAGLALHAKPPACVVQGQNAVLRPVHLLFLLDQSGSMGDGKNGIRSQKWDPVTAALKAFFTDGKSKGMTASLTLFPKDLNKSDKAASASYGLDCEAEAYSMPDVPFKALPDHTFATIIDAVTPPNEYGTPTQPALGGILEQALVVQHVDPLAKVAVVMVTDGEPASCDQGGNTLAGTVAIAESVAAQAPVYVVGVGESLTNLHQIAKGGGTGSAFIVSVDDPAETQRALLDTFAEILGKERPCNAPIPEKKGRIFEKEKIEVHIKTGAETKTVEYNADCQGGAGWHYDDVSAPKEIQLCETSCAALANAAAAQLEVEFACVPKLTILK